MPRSSAEILASARTELARGRPRATLRELEAARAELRAAADVDGLRELLELAHGVRTLAPADSNSRERLLEATERDIALLSPGAPAEVTTRPVSAVSAGGQFVPYGGFSREQILAPARFEIERRKTRRALGNLEKARRKLLARFDVDGLGELLSLAQRLPTAKARHAKARRRLIDATQQNVRYLSRRSALKAGDEWSDPFAAAEPKASAKLPSLPPMTRREILVSAAIVIAIVGVFTAWALANRAPQRVAHAIDCPTGQQGSPTWSPDGKEIAFAKNGSCGTQITIVSAEGGPTRELTERYGVLPDWSPDGRTILYRSHDGFSTIPVGGGESHLLRSDDGAMGAVWSPDGSEIAYTHGLRPDLDAYSSTAYVMRSDGSDPKRIIGHSCNPGTPEWFPNEEELTFACLDGIYVKDLATGKVFSVGNAWFEYDDGVLLGDPGYPVPPKVSWSPDGRSIAYGWGGVFVKSSKKGASSSRVWRETLNYEVGLPEETTVDVSWSPDGRRIAYSVTDNGSDDGLYVIDRDGSHRRRLVSF